MSTGSSTQVTRRGAFPRLRDTRIRAKLALILLVPLAAVIVLAATRLSDVSRRAAEASQVQKLTELGTHVSTLDQLLHDERMAGAAYLSDPKAPVDPYNAAVRASDAEIKTFRTNRRELTDVPDAVQNQLVRIDDNLNTLDTTRAEVIKRDGIGAAEVIARYGVVLTDLLDYGDAVSRYAGDDEVGDRLRATSAFAHAKAGASELEATAYAAVVSGDLSVEQRTAFIAAQTRQQSGLLSFTSFASPGERALVDGVVTGDAVNLADQVSTQLGRGVRVPPADVTHAFGAVVDLMRWAEQTLESYDLVLARDDRDAVVRQAAIEAALVLLVLLAAIGLAVAMARSLNLSLRRLREGALTVANRDLPEAVARLRDSRNLGEGGVDDILRETRDPIRMDSRDEIGQVAQAFNVVHQEAIRIAAEQAALRTSVSTMFLNLARRSQSLVDRMIGELDSIERTEEDPKRLARLFELDHLATRMRRNDENLLVLAGADSTAPRREDALLVDALRAAQSEVELYNRIEFGTVDTDISVAALAVNDVVRLIAELLDNATRFSPPTTTVVADARRVRDYVVVQVEDRGLGLSEEQLDQLNLRLAEPPNVDVAAFRLMGLAVVGRLASRYGIRVELRANLEGGTVAQVVLPASIVVLPSRGLHHHPNVPELNSLPAGGWDPAGSLAATATLPAIAPEPWREQGQREQGRREHGLREQGQREQDHPQLPMFPSQRQPHPLPAGESPVPDLVPTPDRPPLPTRAAKPANGFPAFADAEATEPEPIDPAETARIEMGSWGAALAAMPPVPATPEPAPVEERTEAPIFVQMQQSWFRNHDEPGPEEWGMPTAGYAPPPNSGSPRPTSAAPASVSAPPVAVVPVPVVAPVASPVSVSPVSASPVSASPLSTVPVSASPVSPSMGHNGPVPKPRTAAEDRWRTAADDGWKRAMAAAEPHDAGTTRSGLPKRVPQAQLVPGGVQGGTGKQNRRSPDEVRGLLSAYHRGVQRGRTDGSAESAAFQAKEKEQ